MPDPSAPASGAPLLVTLSDDEMLRSRLRSWLAAAIAPTRHVLAPCDDLRPLSERPAAVVVDLQGAAGPRWELLRRLRLLQPDVVIVALSDDVRIPTIVQAVKLGADGFLPRASSIEELGSALAEHLRGGRTATTDPLQTHYMGVVGASGAIRRTWRLVEAFAPADIAVLILGESGTGKELFARAIHALSPRSAMPFVAVDCATLPDTLIESELFGFRRGAFTGAERDAVGRFEEAHGGTLFLDEIGNLTPQHQAKLLRAIQERSVTRLGETHPRAVDVRLVAATNVALPEAVANGAFRLDLYHRLCEGVLELPPLRDRREDVGLLVKSFIDRFNQRFGRNVEGVSLETLGLLEAYPWPGNVRELENVVKRAVLLSDQVILAEHLPEHLRSFVRPSGSGLGAEVDRLVAACTSTDGADIKEIVRTVTDLVERHVLTTALEIVGTNKRRLADHVGLDYKNLLAKLRRLHLDERHEPDRPTAAPAAHPRRTMA